MIIIFSFDFTCKRGSVGRSEELFIPRSSVRFRLNPENSNFHGFELHRPSIKGTELPLKVFKAIMIIQKDRHRMNTEPDGYGGRGVHGWCTHPLCGYRHYTVEVFTFHKYDVKHTPKQHKLDCLKSESKGATKETPASVAHVAARPTDERFLVRGWRGEQRT